VFFKIIFSFFKKSEGAVIEPDGGSTLPPLFSKTGSPPFRVDNFPESIIREMNGLDKKKAACEAVNDDYKQYTITCGEHAYQIRNRLKHG